MKIKCEKCFVEYEVPEARLSLQHPHFFKCSACGFVFKTGIDGLIESESENVNEIPVVEQSTTVPMPLSEIFQQQDVLKPQTDEQEEIHFQDIENKNLKETDEDVRTSALFSAWDETDEFMPVGKSEKKTVRSIVVFFVCVFLFVCAVCYLLYSGRYYFSKKFDFAENLYQKVGVSSKITAEGLAFQNTSFDSLAEDSAYTLLIKSQVVNTTDSSKNVPVVLINILDDKGLLIQQQEVFLGKDELSFGEKIDFEAKLSLLTNEARQIELTFKKETK